MEAEGDMDAMESAFMTGLFYLLPVTHRNARTQSAIASRSQLQALRNSVVPAIPKHMQLLMLRRAAPASKY